MISVSELKSALKNLNNEKYSDEQIEEIIKKVDYDNNGEINYTEFLMGTLNEKHLSEQNLK